MPVYSDFALALFFLLSVMSRKSTSKYFKFLNLKFFTFNFGSEFKQLRLFCFNLTINTCTQSDFETRKNAGSSGI